MGQVKILIHIRGQQNCTSSKCSNPTREYQNNLTCLRRKKELTLNDCTISAFRLYSMHALKRLTPIIRHADSHSDSLFYTGHLDCMGTTYLVYGCV